MKRLFALYALLIVFPFLAFASGTSGTGTGTSLTSSSGSGTVSSLTTSGTTGASTLSGGVLNIPIYSKGSSAIEPNWYTSDATGTITPGVYSGGGGNGAPYDFGFNLAGGVSSGIIALSLRFQMPSSIPSGTFKFMSRCLTSQVVSANAIKYTISDADVGATSPSAATLTAETQTQLGATTTDAYLFTKTTLTSTPIANDVSVVQFQLNATGTPVTNCNFFEIWE